MSDIILTKLQFTPLTFGVILILQLKFSKFGSIKLRCFELNWHLMNTSSQQMNGRLTSKKYVMLGGMYPNFETLRRKTKITPN